MLVRTHTHAHAAQKRAGHSPLAAQRETLKKQLEQPGLAPAERARLQKELDKVQAKIMIGPETLKTKRAELQEQLASDELSGPERAETQQKLDKVQAKIMIGPDTLKTKRAELQEQLAEQDLAPAVEASLEKELGAVQSKLSAGGNALPWFGLGRLLSQLAAHQPFDRAAPSGCVEPECGSSAGRLGRWTAGECKLAGQPALLYTLYTYVHKLPLYASISHLKTHCRVTVGYGLF
jgi:hypothetical protein